MRGVKEHLANVPRSARAGQPPNTMSCTPRKERCLKIEAYLFTRRCCMKTVHVYSHLSGLSSSSTQQPSSLATAAAISPFVGPQLRSQPSEVTFYPDYGGDLRWLAC